MMGGLYRADPASPLLEENKLSRIWLAMFSRYLQFALGVISAIAVATPSANAQGAMKIEGSQPQAGDAAHICPDVLALPRRRCARHTIGV